MNDRRMSLKQLVKLLNMKGKMSLTSALRGIVLKNLTVEIRCWKRRRVLGTINGY
ncbi:unnamed protein product [Nezara viridula]|uniref:Uncharacterized protein n=1 Tax=Nezara viridula TaxID=85310 RepID=A0A9P0E7H3_NEZVI|nr:unnamed protein product [Nezara viridula]